MMLGCILQSLHIALIHGFNKRIVERTEENRCDGCGLPLACLLVRLLVGWLFRCTEDLEQSWLFMSLQVIGLLITSLLKSALVAPSIFWIIQIEVSCRACLSSHC